MVGIVLAPSPQQPVSLMLNEKVKRRESEFERTPNNSRLLFPNHRSTNHVQFFNPLAPELDAIQCCRETGTLLALLAPRRFSCFSR